MPTVTVLVTSSWTRIFDITLKGYFSFFLKEESENFCKGYIEFSENGSLSLTETDIISSRGIHIISYLKQTLPLSFYFEGETRTYEIQKTVDNYIEIRILSGSDIQVTFNLFSEHTDKILSFSPRKTSSNKNSFSVLGTISVPVINSGSVECISSMDSDITSYTVMLYDKKNKAILLTSNLVNTETQTNSLGSLANISPLLTEIEISIKKTGGSLKSNVYLENLSINYY